MKKQIFLFIIFLCISYGIDAQIYCPNDVTISCFSDLTPDECGMATIVSGNYHPSMLKYIDQNETNACNEGIVYRRFYIDIDFNNTYTENEPSCIQTITLLYDNLPLNIQYPTDKEYSCLDDIPEESPTWLSNPCDLVGFTYKDEIFEFEEGACLKIVRTFSVINWCVYDADTNDGLYTGIQIIKIVDQVAPEITDCEDKYFDAGQNCDALVTLSNFATDSGDCPSGTLTWRVSIDLWADGTDDLFYGPNEPVPFRLDPVANGEQVNVVLPEALEISKHKVVWKVTDGCGNVKSCSNEFFIEDNKPPTPYCLNLTSASLDGKDDGQLVIPASFFDVGGVDNCSPQDDIIISFSSNTDDTEKIIKCGDTGFQFFRIYYTDEAGNQDFCEVFMLIFDNGSCFGKYAPSGILTKPNGAPIEGVSAYLMDNEDVISLVESDYSGFFSFGEQDLMERYNAEVKKEQSDMETVDIDDFILMRSALLGLEGLNFYQKVAADLNHDNVFDIDDLFEFRDILLGNSEIEDKDAWKFIPKMHNMSQSQTNLHVSNSIPYTSYGEGFNYYGVQSGDLTGSSFIIENSAQTEGVVELTLKISKDEVSILSYGNLVTEAVQIDFSMNDMSASNITKNVAFDFNGDGTRYTNLTPWSTLEDDNTMISAYGNFTELEHPLDLIKSAKIFRSGSLRPSAIHWTIEDNREEKLAVGESPKFNVYPLPMQDQLTIEGAEIINLSLYTIAGEPIDIETFFGENRAEISTQNSLPSGVYVLKVTSSEGENAVKIVKY